MLDSVDRLFFIGQFLLAVGFISHLILLWREGVHYKQYTHPAATVFVAMQAAGLAIQFFSSSSLFVEHRLEVRSAKPTIAFNAPVNLYEGDVASVELIIEKGNQQSILNSLRELQPKDGPSDDRATDTMPLSKSVPIIIATLEGIGFTILPTGPQKREGEFRWSWQVKAEQSTPPSLKGDDRLLSIRLEGQIGTGQTAKVILLRGPQPRRVHVLPKTMTLVQQAIDWLKDLNPYLAGAGALMAAIFGWLSRGFLGRMWRRFRNGPDFDQT
jgi:hypothetical protein